MCQLRKKDKANVELGSGSVEVMLALHFYNQGALLEI